MPIYSHDVKSEPMVAAAPNGFFRAGDASPTYCWIRGGERQRDVRDRIEAMWVRYRPLCLDPDFRKDAMVHFNARVWQMYLACVLLDHGHVLEPSGADAPDLKVRRPDGTVIWIEVTTAEAGEGANRAKRIYQSDPSMGSAVYQLDETKMILRYQNAIRLKLRHRERFIARGAIGAGDPYVIAINAADVDDADLDDGLPNIVRAVYPIGELQFAYRVNLDENVREEDFDHDERAVRPYTPSVPTPRGVAASTVGFADGSMAGVSAVIFCPDGIWNAPADAGRECITVYNQTASAPIPIDTFKFGESFHGDGEAVHGADWRRPLPVHDPRTHEEIAVAAYHRWLRRGGLAAPEAALDDWLAAEREIMLGP